MSLERASQDELRSVQLERLKWSVRHAYDNVEHYRRRFEAHGVHPDDMKRLEDLRLFPFLKKQDFRDNYPYGLFAVPMSKIARLHASSGTTGKPTVVGYTSNAVSNWADLVARSIQAAGGRAGDKVHVAYGYGLFTGGLGAHYGAERLGCTVIPMSGGQTEKQVQLICDLEPEIIMVTPSYMLAILDEFRRQGVDPRATSLKLGMFGAEPWTEAMRREIEDAFNLDAVDIYGLSEVMGPGVACECVEAKDGPTIWEDHFYPEVVDPETREPLPDGQEDELVFTSLSKQAMPENHKRTRDQTRLLPGTARPMRRMAKITGRSDDMLIIRGVNVFPTQIVELVLRCEALSPHFLLELSRPDRMDELKVLVEANHGASDREAEAARLQALIKELVGVSAAVEVVAPDALPRSMGKAARVRDLR